MSEENIFFKYCNYCKFFINEKMFEKNRKKCKYCRVKDKKCIHKKFKFICRECDGIALCKHNKRKQFCNYCKGISLCEHNKRKQYCKECKGGSLCHHNKRKEICIICNVNCACIFCKSKYVSKRTKFYPYCEECFSNIYPNNPVVRHFKRKEYYFQDEIQKRLYFEDVKIIFNKSINDGCSNKRPDILIDLFLFVLIVECDENQHKNKSYTPECENKRMMSLFQDLGYRPIVFIRFNPDSYIDKENRIKGCFKDIIDENKKKYYKINYEEWNNRLNIVEKNIRKYINMSKDGLYPIKDLTIEMLYYDKN